MTTLAPKPQIMSPTSLATATATPAKQASPILLLFSSYTCGLSRRLDGFVSHVLQRRHNHGTFRYRIILKEDRPDLFERFAVEEAPTLLVIDDKRVQARLVGYHKPFAVEELLMPWLR